MSRLLAFLLIASAAHAFEAKVLWGGENNPREAINILITGDGWQAGEQAAYESLCLKFINAMFETSPYNEYKKYFKFTSKFVQSKDHGCKRLFKDGKFHLFKKMNDKEDNDTAFGSIYKARPGTKTPPNVLIERGDRCIPLVTEMLEGVSCSMVLIVTPDEDLSGGAAIVNQEIERIVGKAGIVIMTAYDITKPNDIGQTLAHELGHAAFNLGDEYNGSGCEPPRESDEANVTIYPGAPKWQGLIDRKLVGDPVPGGISCTGGAAGSCCSKGVWRPTNKCRMFSQTHTEFCAVCKARMAHAIAERSSLIQGSDPKGLMVVGSPMQMLTFTVKTTCVEPGTDRYDAFFEVDGRTRQGTRHKDSTGDSWELKTSFPMGSHKVRFSVRDTQQNKDFPSPAMLPTVSSSREWWLDIKLTSALVPGMPIDDSSP